MKSLRLYEQGGLRRYLLVMDKGDEACSEIVAFARDRGIRSASLTAIGAASRAMLGYFNPETDEYEYTTHDEQVELASFVGDIAWGGEGADAQPVLHAHGVLGRRDGSALAGHFAKLYVFPTMEITLVESPVVVRKQVDPDTGLELISLDETGEGANAQAPRPRDLPWGVNHVGLTVPDLDEATAFLRAAFGARVAYDGLTRGDEPRRGPEVERQLGLPEGAAIRAQRMLQIGTGPGLEMLEVDTDVRQGAAGLADLGWGHVALLVDDIDAVMARAVDAGAHALSGPHANSRHEDTPGNASVYLRAPWGSIIELQTLPHGHWYGSGSEVELWSPPPLPWRSADPAGHDPATYREF